GSGSRAARDAPGCEAPGGPHLRPRRSMARPVLAYARLLSTGALSRRLVLRVGTSARGARTGPSRGRARPFRLPRWVFLRLLAAPRGVPRPKCPGVHLGTGAARRQTPQLRASPARGRPTVRRVG